MIDCMLAELKQEQQDDADLKEYCSDQLDKADDKMKALQRTVSDLEGHHHPGFDFLVLAPPGKRTLTQGTFVKMIDSMMADSKQEQQDDAD